MGWALTYTVKWGRPLTEQESALFKQWTEKNDVHLEPTSATPALESWRGVVPEEVLEKMAKPKAQPPRIPGADYEGFLQLRSDASFRKAVRIFQELQTLFPFAEIILSDDYHLQNAAPSSVDFKNLPTKSDPAPERHRVPPPVPDEPEAPEPLDEVEQALERARKDFNIWKSRPGAGSGSGSGSGSKK